MDTKPLLYGLAGFLIGGLLVSVAANTFDKPIQKNQETSMAAMTESLRDKTGDDFDKLFIAHMIKHHQGAIYMAKLAKDNAKHDEIKNMADDIISAQSKEIDMMQTWQGDWGYKTAPKSHEMNH